MNEAISAGRVIFCFGRCFSYFLALGTTFVLMEPSPSTVCGYDNEKISTININSVVTD